MLPIQDRIVDLVIDHGPLSRCQILERLSGEFQHTELNNALDALLLSTMLREVPMLGARTPMFAVRELDAAYHRATRTGRLLRGVQ